MKQVLDWFPVGIVPERAWITLTLNLSPSLTHQKRMQPHHGLETVAKPGH